MNTALVLATLLATPTPDAGRRAPPTVQPAAAHLAPRAWQRPLPWPAVFRRCGAPPLTIEIIVPPAAPQ